MFVNLAVLKDLWTGTVQQGAFHVSTYNTFFVYCSKLCRLRVSDACTY